MIHSVKPDRLITRRGFLRAAAAPLLAAPALILVSRGAALAQGRDPMRKVACTEDQCSYTYDPRIGDPAHGIPPGVAFEDLPHDWACPECGTELRFW